MTKADWIQRLKLHDCVSICIGRWSLTIGWLLCDEFIFQGVQFLLFLWAHGRDNLVTSCTTRWGQPGQKPIHFSVIGRSFVRVLDAMLCARPDRLLTRGSVRRTNFVQSSRRQANFDTESLGYLGKFGLYNMIEFNKTVKKWRRLFPAQQPFCWCTCVYWNGHHGHACITFLYSQDNFAHSVLLQMTYPTTVQNLCIYVTAILMSDLKKPRSYRNIYSIW